jgi:S1-C subfamily serine protease
MAGILEHDILTKVNGSEVKSPRELFANLAMLKGQKVTFQVWRQGSYKDIQVQLAGN